MTRILLISVAIACITSGLVGCSNDCPKSLTDGQKALNAKIKTTNAMPEGTKAEVTSKIPVLDGIVKECKKLVEDHKEHDRCKLNDTQGWDMEADRKACDNAESILTKLRDKLANMP